MSLTKKIFIAMALGILFGSLANIVAPLPYQSLIENIVFLGLFDFIGKIFIASLKVLVVPMVFISLTCGAASLGGHGNMGVMAGKTIGLYLMTTAIAISIALSLALLIEPGKQGGFTVQSADESSYQAVPAPPLKEVLINIFPDNPVKAMAEGNMLQVIVFAILFGIAISRSDQLGVKVLKSFESLNAVIMEMIMMLMHLAPYGVFCLLAKIFYSTGFDLIQQLLAYFLTVVTALVFHAAVIYTLLLRVLTGFSPRQFLLHLRPVLMFGFSTASSNATMPITLDTVQKKMGIKKSVAAFTVPLGATINMDGTAIMQGVATVFIAQAYQIDVGVVGYLTVILTATLASVGTAGVPGVGLITLALVLQQVGLPVEGIALIIGVDRLLDMLRTAVNLTGDSLVACVVANSEQAIDKTVFNQKIVNE
ncbi:MAG: dicarboxylate/amino acid:cation symporter [Pseudomonadales bacterium]|nr:dicarboxylate/amino acid:cation symporter [Pseudomonadales bacterium]